MLYSRRSEALTEPISSHSPAHPTFVNWCCDMSLLFTNTKQLQTTIWWSGLLYNDYERHACVLCLSSFSFCCNEYDIFFTYKCVADKNFSKSK